MSKLAKESNDYITATEAIAYIAFGKWYDYWELREAHYNKRDIFENSNSQQEVDIAGRELLNALLTSQDRLELYGTEIISNSSSAINRDSDPVPDNFLRLNYIHLDFLANRLCEIPNQSPEILFANLYGGIAGKRRGWENLKLKKKDIIRIWPEKRATDSGTERRDKLIKVKGWLKSLLASHEYDSHNVPIQEGNKEEHYRDNLYRQQFSDRQQHSDRLFNDAWEETVPSTWKVGNAKKNQGKIKSPVPASAA